MAIIMKKFLKGLVLRGLTDESTISTLDGEGALFHNSSDSRIKAYIEGAVRQVVTNSQSQVLTNKTIIASNNDIVTAASGNLTSTKLNDALAELQGDVDTRVSKSGDTMEGNLNMGDFEIQQVSKVSSGLNNIDMSTQDIIITADQDVYIYSGNLNIDSPSVNFSNNAELVGIGTIKDAGGGESINPELRYLISGSGQIIIDYENGRLGNSNLPTGNAIDWSSGVEISVETPLNMNNYAISNVLDPSSDQDAATKKYVDDSIPAPTTYTKLGAGADIISSTSASAIEYKSLKQGSNVTITEDLNEITISASAGAINLSDLSDVSIISPTDGQSLVYNATSSKWEPLTITGGTGGGFSGAYVDTFSGDGLQTDFILANPVDSVVNTEVYISGVYQQKSTYSVSGTTISFSEAPPIGTDNIEVCSFTTGVGSKFEIFNTIIFASNLPKPVSEIFIADGSSNPIYSLSIPASNSSSTVFYDGMLLSVGVEYNIVGTNLELYISPPVGSEIRVETPARGILYYKVPYDMIIDKQTFQIFEKGLATSGILEFDIKKNTTPADDGMVSIFASKASIDFSTASDFDEFIGNFTTLSLSANEWLRLDITSTPSDYTGPIQITMYGA